MSRAKDRNWLTRCFWAAILGLGLGFGAFLAWPGLLRHHVLQQENRLPALQQIYPRPQPRVQQLTPLPGHWLMTLRDQEGMDRAESSEGQREQDAGKLPGGNLRQGLGHLAGDSPGLDLGYLPGPSGGQDPGRLAQNRAGGRSAPLPKESQSGTPEGIPAATGKPGRRLNKTLHSLNIVYLWTDGNKLKVLSVMAINHRTGEAALVVIPRFTRVRVEGRDTTIDELYRTGGRPKVARYLEQLLEMKLPNYLNVDQQAVIDISNLVGPLSLKGEKITILEAFEQTRAGKRTDDQDVVRAVAKKIVNPKILLQLPEIIWIFAHDVKTNLGTEELLTIYRISRQSKVTEMRKLALPGRDVYQGGRKYRLVSEDTWKNIFYDLTN